MRYLYATLIGLLVVLMLVFALQNRTQVTLTFLTMSATLPLALMVTGVYVSGVLTGGFVVALLRTWFAGARAK